MNLTYIVIAVLASLSYLLGFFAILKPEYHPNVFSRTVWLVLALNNLVSVVKLSSGTSTSILAWVTLFGSLLIFLGAIFIRGERLWGRSETISSMLLGISLLIWIFTDIPFINLCIGLIAHCIGSIPTLVRVFKKPQSENIPFWIFFALASIITFLSTHSDNPKDYLFAAYFCIFDSTMTVLAFRKYFTKHLSKVPL
jgi:hypothetical protein